MQVLALVKAEVPHVPVIVRTRDDHDMGLLRQAGASEVVPDAFEVSLSLATQTLSHLGLSEQQISRLVAGQRQSQYASLKNDAHESF